MEFGLFVPCHRLPWRDPFSRISKRYAQVMEIAKAEGIAQPPKLAVSRITYGKTDGDALDAMADIQVSHCIFMRLFKNQADVKGGFTEPEPVDDEYGREQLLENLVAGSPATCVEKVRAYEQLGVDQFILYGAFGPDHARTMASLRRFAEDVMPHFAKGSRA
jgi:alkanesulfonate monooxygenase SsuD/methylene tetrahydromethanopterin reductase-like flavin-dependent oxidoreductase (luciferase family)